jgi:hypothetical protein
MNTVLQGRPVLKAFDHQTAATHRHHVRIERAFRQRQTHRGNRSRRNGHLPHVGILRSWPEDNDVTELGPELVQFQHQECAQTAGYHDRHRTQDRQPGCQGICLGSAIPAWFVPIGSSHGLLALDHKSEKYAPHQYCATQHKSKRHVWHRLQTSHTFPTRLRVRTEPIMMASSALGVRHRGVGHGRGSITNADPVVFTALVESHPYDLSDNHRHWRRGGAASR